MNILGISAFYHDSAAALVCGGEIVAAAQEERFTRRKGDESFPQHAIAACLAHAGLTAADLDAVAYYEKPLLKFERILETHVATVPAGFASFRRAMPVWLRTRIWLEDMIRARLQYKGPVYFPPHHTSHAASAYYPSPFESAAILTLDGVGEWSTSTWGVGTAAHIELAQELRFPHSLGLLYSAFTAYLGFRVNSGEYKVMGLAPYGRPVHAPTIRRELVDIASDGSFRMNMRHFAYPAGLTMTHPSFHDLFGGPPRAPTEPIEPRHMDIAASVQQVTNEIVTGMARHVRAETGESRLCLAGGVALNCVANAKIIEQKIFDRVWIQPAAGDSGGAVGAALYAFHELAGGVRQPAARDGMRGSLLGPAYTSAQVQQRLAVMGADYTVHADEELLPLLADLLAEGSAVGWFSGRMEFGPRALGARSILADPRDAQMQSRLNLKIKFRESFRPFAPACVAEDAAEWFDFHGESPYMLFTAPVCASKRTADADADEDGGLGRIHAVRSRVPAVTHVDGSARLQTVDRADHPRFHELLSCFKRRTGVGMLVNTSFNVRGEPIVESPEDAYRCFMATGLDVLVVENCLLHKSRQPAAPVGQRTGFDPD